MRFGVICVRARRIDAVGENMMVQQSCCDRAFSGSMTANEGSRGPLLPLPEPPMLWRTGISNELLLRAYGIPQF